jgi:hypothetical protein
MERVRATTMAVDRSVLRFCHALSELSEGRRPPWWDDDRSVPRLRIYIEYQGCRRSR